MLAALVFHPRLGGPQPAVSPLENHLKKVMSDMDAMVRATLRGRRGQADRLLGYLAVDVSKSRKLVGWKPPLTVFERLAFLGNSEL